MRTIQQSVENYKSSVALVPARYKQGIAGADWAGAVRRPETEANWAAGVSKAAAEQAFSRGVARVSNEEWRRAAAEKGAASIGQGMTLGADKYSRRFGPILDAMNSAAASLPARSQDAMSNIDNRLKPVVQAAMQAARTSTG